jgi:hypothetical protein
MKARKAALVSLLSGALIVGTAAIGSAAPQDLSAKNAKQVNVTLKPSTPRLKTCFPRAEAKVTVDLTTASRGFDTFTIRAKGLRPNTDFTVFLLQQSGPPFGAAEYFGDFTTNGKGEGVNQFRLIVEEAFAFNGDTLARTDLNAIGVWFADEKDDDGCLGANSPVTGFDGDGKAGVQMLNSGNKLLP